MQKLDKDIVKVIQELSRTEEEWSQTLDPLYRRYEPHLQVVDGVLMYRGGPFPV